MRWPVALILCYLALGFDLGAGPALELGSSGARPWLTLGVVVFIAMYAPVMAAMWTGVLVGLAVDLLSETPLIAGAGGVGGAGVVVVPGPHAIGFLLGAYLTVNMRGMMIVRNPLAVGFAALCAGTLAELVRVAVMSAHRLAGDPIAWRGTGAELLGGLGTAAYSGVAAVILAVLLTPALPLLGVQDPSRVRFGRRA